MKKEKREMRKRIFFMTASLVILIMAVFMLNGCGAAIGAYSIYKGVQSTTDGSVEMVIGENEISGGNKLILTEISRIAVWPDNEGEVMLADKLQKSKVFSSVVTPSKVGRMIRQNDLDQKIGNLTQAEMIDAFQTICQKTETEAIVAFKGIEAKTDANAWSFDRASMSFKVKLLIYTVPAGKIIYSAPAMIKVHLGGSSPNKKKILRDFAEVVAQKIIQLRRPIVTAKVE